MQPDCIERYNSHVAFRRVMTGCSLTDVANRLQQGKTYAYEKLEGAVGQERLIQTTSCAEQVQAKAGIFKRRLTNILDTSTDLLVVIDNATTWNGPYAFFFSWDPAWDPWWAVIGATSIIAPLFAEALCLRDNAAVSLQRSLQIGPVAANIIWFLCCIPTIITLKLYMLFFYPWHEAGYTELSFLGAFSQLDFLMEASLESPFSAAFSTYMAVRKLQLHRSHGGKFPTMILVSFAASLGALYEVYRHLRRLRERENVGDYGYVLQPGDKGYLSLLDTITLAVSAGRGSQYSQVGSRLLPGELEELAVALQRPSTLKNLHLESCDLADTAAATLFEALAQNDSLKVLTVRFNGIQRLDVFAAALETNRTLHELVLSYNDISNIDSLCAVLELPTSTLRVLSLRHNPIHGVGGIAKALEKNQSLQKLFLRECGITDLDCLGKALFTNRSLQVLKLDGNKICDIAVLGQALASNGALQELWLENNDISNIEALCKALESNTTALQVLKLGRNIIAEVHLLEPALAANATLKELWLEGNNIRDVARLVKGLYRNKALRKLNMSDNPLLSEGTIKLRNARAASATLKELVLVEDERSNRKETDRRISEKKWSMKKAPMELLQSRLGSPRELVASPRGEA
eukprot:TRINITY_DN24349_c0_g1_i4.p1 TRINITY_DN24349_c0_g1~~TRINITY_DN24349_c0_g1_i4.p1  ORF type:complete len:634 (-),score=78.86 TRINITY_DN24349_c0_g1_i4:275-2176(-)